VRKPGIGILCREWVRQVPTIDKVENMKRISLADIPEEGVSHNPEIRKQVMLARGAVPHLTNFSRSRLAPGQVARGHKHADMHEVFFVESGTGVINVDGREYTLGKGICVAVEPKETHEVANNGEEDLILVYFGIEV
jgi:quercetin dioxygenase-like cupin family protein